MKSRIALFITAAIVGALAVLVGMVIGAHNARGSSITCPVTGAGQWQRCIMVKPGMVGQQITDQRDCFKTTPFMATDYLGAPEVWIRCGSLYIGGKTGWLGGVLCITEGLTQQTCLSKADIDWLHRQEAATP